MRNALALILGTVDFTASGLQCGFLSLQNYLEVFEHIVAKACLTNPQECGVALVRALENIPFTFPALLCNQPIASLVSDQVDSV